MLDEGEFVAAHAFVVAPPFSVIDLTVRYQPNLGAFAELLPTSVLSESTQLTAWNADDLANPSVQRAAALRHSTFQQFLEREFPDMSEVLEQLPARMVRTALATLKYVPVAVAATMEPLESITGYKPCGRTAQDIFAEDILPAIARDSCEHT